MPTPAHLLDGLPALLVSYAFLNRFLERKANYAFRDWALDSGAFTAHGKGETVDLQKYIDTCRRLRDSDPQLAEIFALDVIGDWRASIRNCEEMWRQGIEAIPCYHVGEPVSVLTGLARDYPKIALGGAVGYRDRVRWAQQCFARIWPKRVHGFGFGSEKTVLCVPWHSVDASSWELRPYRFAQWNAFGGILGTSFGSMNLSAELEWYVRMERRVQSRWRNEMAVLGTTGPTVRLACVTVTQGERQQVLLRGES